MRRGGWLRLGSLALIGVMVLGCSAQAPYMRGWDVVEGKNHRWTGGTFKEQKLSLDEATVYQELGTPEIIRFFRELHTRQHVYEWLYEAKDEVVWFVDGARVEYVAVDPNTSGLTKETRETVQGKAVTGGLLATVVGGFAAGFLLLGDSLGLKE